MAFKLKKSKGFLIAFLLLIFIISISDLLYFIINAPQLTSNMLGYDIQNDKFLEERLKPRIEAYLKRLLKSYLLNEHDNTNK